MVEIYRLLLVGILVFETLSKDLGPFVIPDWEIPFFPQGKFEGEAEVIVFPDQLKVMLFTARAWRYVWEWSFLNSHRSEINSYVIIPDFKEAREWIERVKCKVGKEYENSRDDDCYKNLSEMPRDNWIDKRTLKTIPPTMKAWMSTCSVYYSCDFHPVKFPLYVDSSTFQPYIAGPHGETIKVAGGKSIRLVRIEDSFLAFETISNEFKETKVETKCVWSGGNPDTVDMYCNYNREGKQVTVKFKPNETKKAFNNIIFYRPTIPKRRRRDVDNDADAATKGDLKELQNKVLLLSENLLILFHELVEELANIKHVTRNLILSTAKIDDNLIGKIAKIPAKTKWLNDETFILSSGIETMLHHGTPVFDSSCLGSYKYRNGRWSLESHELSCSVWNKTHILDLLTNRVVSPLKIDEGPEFRNASSEYSGWSFLDNGRVSLDWLDEGLKYWKKGSGFNLSLEGLNFTQIFMAVIYIIIFFVIIFLISFLCKLLRL